MGLELVHRAHRVEARAPRVLLVYPVEGALPAEGVRVARDQRVELHGLARDAVDLEQEAAILLVVALAEGARDDLDRAAVELREHGAERRDLLRGGEVARHGAPVL